jgi:hypothetical protein
LTFKSFFNSLEKIKQNLITSQVNSYLIASCLLGFEEFSTSVAIFVAITDTLSFFISRTYDIVTFYVCSWALALLLYMGA